MNNKELLTRLENEIKSLRNEAEDKVDFYNEHNLKLQAAAIDYKVEAYNKVLQLLREAQRDVDRESRKCYNYESNLTDITMKWL